MIVLVRVGDRCHEANEVQGGLGPCGSGSAPNHRGVNSSKLDPFSG